MFVALMSCEKHISKKSTLHVLRKTILSFVMRNLEDRRMQRSGNEGERWRMELRSRKEDKCENEPGRKMSEWRGKGRRKKVEVVRKE